LSGKVKGVDLAGFARPVATGLPEVHLAPYICDALARYAYGPPPDMDDLAEAIGALTHESEHLVSSSSSESITECYAVQHMARPARLLGVPPARARALQLYYWRVIYPFRPLRLPHPRLPAQRPARRLARRRRLALGSLPRT
jgi:hypothetical protein